MTKFMFPLMATIGMLVLFSCQRSKVSELKEEPLQTFEDTLLVDTFSVLEEDIEDSEEEEYEYIDSDFDDFLFTFIRNNKLQRQRVKYPLHIEKNNEDTTLYYLNCRKEFAFLNNDFYTILYGDANQIEEVKNWGCDTVYVESIDFNTENVKSYNFERLKGKWMLTRIQEKPIRENSLSNFFDFYKHFSTDSIFQLKSIAQPLKFGMIDPEDEGNYIEGTLDAQQWFAFCPEVPKGIISNVRYGQHYSPDQIVLQKCGMANGMEEIFTFQCQQEGWMLISYEN